jgi:hypothetical protein
MKLTKHVKKRSQQRGIKNRHVELLLEHGILDNKYGAYKCYIPKVHLKKLFQTSKNEFKSLRIL